MDETAFRHERLYRHLLGLDPYEGLRIISMTAYEQLLWNEGVLRK